MKNIRLTEAQLHGIIKESVNKILNEFMYYGNEDELNVDDKDMQMTSDWNAYGNMNRLDKPSLWRKDDKEPLGMMAQDKDNSLERAFARNIKNGTWISGHDAAINHGLKTKRKFKF